MLRYTKALLKLVAPKDVELLREIGEIERGIANNKSKLSQASHDGIHEGLRARGLNHKLTLYNKGLPPPGARRGDHAGGTMSRCEVCLGDYEAQTVIDIEGKRRASIKNPPRFYIDRWDPPNGGHAHYTLWLDQMCQQMVEFGPRKRSTTDFWEALIMGIDKRVKQPSDMFIDSNTLFSLYLTQQPTPVASKIAIVPKV